MTDFIDFFEDFDNEYNLYDFINEIEYLEYMIQNYSPRGADKWSGSVTNQFESQAKEHFIKKTFVVTKQSEYIINSGKKYTESKAKVLKSANDKIYTGVKMNKPEANMIKSFVFNYAKELRENDPHLNQKSALKIAWSVAKRNED